MRKAKRGKKVPHTVRRETGQKVPPFSGLIFPNHIRLSARLMFAQMIEGFLCECFLYGGLHFLQAGFRDAERVLFPV